MFKAVRVFLMAAAMVLVVSAFATPSYADTQTVSGCTNCNGYTFQATLTPTGVAGQYTLTYTVTNVSGATANPYNWSLTLFQSGNVITGTTLNSVTGGGNNYTSDYVAHGGKSNNGNTNCSAGVSDAFCVEPALGAHLPQLAQGQSLTFNLTITCQNCTELSNWIFLSSGNCVSNPSANCYAISTAGQVPEPSVLAMLGVSGVLGLCSLARRRLRALS